jgi:acyl-CoA reductase-like NAD-dependent aldehyde dehydrogenase
VQEPAFDLRAQLAEAIERGLPAMAPAVFRESAEWLLDRARELLEQNERELARAITLSVSRSTKRWAARHGNLGAYSEGLAERAPEYARVLGTEPRPR